jgi:enterochelin esterase family protein
MASKARSIAACALVMLGTLGVPGLAAAAEPLRSPRLVALEQQLAGASKGAALEKFWQDVDGAGTPIIETVPARPGRVLMTFVWRSEDARESLNVGMVGLDKSSFESRVDPFARLAQSDVWYRTYEVESAARIQYYLAWPEGRQPSADRLEPYSTDHGVGYELFEDPRSHLKVRYEIGTLASSYAQGPDAPPEHWLAGRAGIAKGQSKTLQAASTILGNSRDITVYIPAGYPCTGRGCPFVLVFDRTEYLQTIDVPNLLDNMIADRVIPPMAAVLVNYFDRDLARERELTPNPDFPRFLIEELLPKLRSDYRLASDPRQVVIAGASYGGLASTYIARTYPHIFGNVLSQSGSYWWYPDYDLADEVNFPAHWNWLPRQFVSGPKLPLRFYLDVGSWEGPAMLTPNRTFRDILRARGYEVSYREFVGAHTYLNWRATFPDGLIALMGTAKGKALLAKEGVLHD